MASRLHEILRKDVFSDIETGPWCLQTTSHYLDQVTPYGVTRRSGITYLYAPYFVYLIVCHYQYRFELQFWLNFFRNKLLRIRVSWEVLIVKNWGHITRLFHGPNDMRFPSHTDCTRDSQCPLENGGNTYRSYDDDVIKWKHFPRNWPFVRGIHRSRWIPRTKASDAELWCFLWSASE